jgi:hypothetical protein
MVPSAASYVQTQGKAHGVLWDPPTMRPLVGSAAMAKALQLLRDIQSVNRDALHKVDLNLTYVHWSECLMSVHVAEVFKVRVQVHLPASLVRSS